MSAADRAWVEEQVHGVVRSILPGLGAAPFDGALHLRELGADSVDRVEIIATVTDRLGLRLPMSQFSDIPSVDALVDHLWRAVQA